MSFTKEIGFYFFQLKSNFENKRALRISFFSQVIGMFLSNISFFVIWMVFSHALGPINGWGVRETFGMLSMSIFTFGVVHTFFGSTATLIYRVPNGAFDSFLTKPKSLYLRILNHEFNVSALGDLIQGILGLIILMIWAKPSFEAVLIVFLMMPTAVIAMISFSMTTDCIVFWLPHAQHLSYALRDLILLPSTQPISLLQGPLRFIYLFAIPVLCVAGLPIEAFTHLDWRRVALSYAISIGWFLLSYWVLSVSLKRYESGNIIG